MIDTHCHLLPGLDDGPRRVEESLALASELTAQGVRHVVCTPHFSRRYRTSQESALITAEALRLAFVEAGVVLELVVAAEVSPMLALEAEAVDLRVRSIGRRYLVVELEADTTLPVIGAVCDRLQTLGLQPVFAHPERCRGVQRNHRPLDEARARGALVQVVAPSLLGRWGSSAAETAWELLATGRADVLASDAHRPQSPSRLDRALRLVRDRMGSKAVQRLTTTNPSLLLQGRPVPG